MIQSVIVSEKAYKQMFSYVIDFANPNLPYRQWREVIGWLVGTVEGETIKVIQAIPMTSGSSIFVQMTDYSIIPKIAEEAEKINAIIVGWFHSHPSFGFFLSGVDIRTQRNQQSLFDNAIALVCDPTKISSFECGIHAFQVYMENHLSRDYRELDLLVETDAYYPDILKELLRQKGVMRSYSDVISHEDLADLYALEGIRPPQLMIKPEELLPSEQRAEPLINAHYVLPERFISGKECYIQVRLLNVGKGIAWRTELTFDPQEFYFKNLSMYPRRIIDRVNYETTIVETFKVKPRESGVAYLPRTIVKYRTTDQRERECVVQSQSVVIQKKR